MALFAACSIVGSPAHALHPTNFPHQHVEHPAPQPQAEPDNPEDASLEERFRPYAGVGLTGGSVIPSGSLLSQGLGGGGGFELFFGCRLNQWTAVDLEWTTTVHSTQGDQGFRVDSALLSTLSGILRIYMTQPHLVEPYVAVGVTLLNANGGPQSSITLMGLGFTAGLGLDINLTHDLTLGIRALYRGGFLDNRVDRFDHLPDFPDEASFMSLVMGSAHVRLSF
jgi:opacity protein-like surface antigen